MKDRPDGFLSEQHIDQDGEVFDYVTELHEYLWKFVRILLPGASGNLRDFVDRALAEWDGKKGIMGMVLGDVTRLKDQEILRLKRELWKERYNRASENLNWIDQLKGEDK